MAFETFSNKKSSHSQQILLLGPTHYINPMKNPGDHKQTNKCQAQHLIEIKFPMQFHFKKDNTLSNEQRYEN
jgi:hypothetical protein